MTADETPRRGLDASPVPRPDGAAGARSGSRRGGDRLAGASVIASVLGFVGLLALGASRPAGAICLLVLQVCALALGLGARAKGLGRRSYLATLAVRTSGAILLATVVGGGALVLIVGAVGRGQLLPK